MLLSACVSPKGLDMARIQESLTTNEHKFTRILVAVKAYDESFVAAIHRGSHLSLSMLLCSSVLLSGIFLFFRKDLWETSFVTYCPHIFSRAVIPAKAGIQKRGNVNVHTHWIPAFAGMTAHLNSVAANGLHKLSVVS